MIMDPALLPWADKLIILVLAVLMFMAARGPRAQTFPKPSPGPGFDPPPVIPVAPPVSPGRPPAVIPIQPPIVVPPVAPPVVIPPAPGSDFDRCVAVTLRPDVEGGNDKADGTVDRTSRGIEQVRDWDVWRNTHPGLPADVFDAPDSEIKAIYKANYWNPLYCDNLPNGVDLCVFDDGVLSGIGTSAKRLQGLVGADQDSEVGPLTIAAAAAQDPVSLVGRLCDARQAYYDGLVAKNPGRNKQYIHGWTNRVVIIRTAALALAAEAPRPKSPTLPSGPNIPAPAIGAPWLTLARSLVGTHATNDNVIITAWPKAIAAKFPDMADYCASYAHDTTPWCGLFVAYVLAMSGAKPVYGAADTDKFLWADAWKRFGAAVIDPQPGDVLVFKWAGGGEHVTFYDHAEDDAYYHCTGGNQGRGHVVSTEAMPMASCIAIRRPPRLSIALA
jgi:uncharacterized protein (TIGR02594 family)